jgi:hypothetical protein
VLLRLVARQIFTTVSQVIAASIIIALMMNTETTCETSVNFYQTARCNIPEDSQLETMLYFM